MITPRFTILPVSGSAKGEFIRVEEPNYSLTIAQAGISNRSIRVHNGSRLWIYERAVNITVEKGLDMIPIKIYGNNRPIQMIGMLYHFVKYGTDQITILCMGDDDVLEWNITNCGEWTNKLGYMNYPVNFGPYGDYIVSFEFYEDGIYVYLIQYDDEASLKFALRHSRPQKEL